MKYATAIAATIVLLLGSAWCAAEETKPAGSSFAINVGYSPLFFFASLPTEDGAVGGAVGPIHGGSLSFDWRGRGHWGVQVPVGFHMNRQAKVADVGVNAIVHLRDREKSVDPYFLLGGRVFIGKGSGSRTQALPAPNVGFGIRGYFSKNVGIFAEAAANPLIVPPVVIVGVEGRAGISIRF